MSYLTEKEMLTFFESNDNHYVNSNFMVIGYSEEEGVWTYLDAGEYKGFPMKVAIATEEYSMNDFIIGFKLESWRDIDSLDYNNSWMRYLNRDAEIIVNPMGLEADISFRIYRSKTRIFSMDLHFYDEVNEHLTMPEDFKNYIIENGRLLNIANDNRHKMNRK